ncbi:VOC family protein [Arthrobacter sp. 35W]|uniref:VOC family protein n=1 Tax=Arthrobacter sp. 35W TaxID=1132441 RepID=UPI0003FF56C9|nr:VOC family protein [Arthrobacter sp. 35W]
MSAFATAAGDPCWIDLATRDPLGAKAFYTALFGWTYDVWDEEAADGYIMAFKDGAAAAGMIKNSGASGQPDGWTTYLRADNLAEVAAAVPSHGGRVLVAPMEVSAQGSMSFVADPAGSTVGLWKPGLHQGFGIHGRPGSAVWHELRTTDYPGTVAFYRAAFGWDTAARDDDGGPRTTTLGEGIYARAGIVDDGEGPIPGRWQVVFGVADAGASTALAATLGGRVVAPVVESTYGRTATLADTTGAVFQIAQLH